MIGFRSSYNQGADREALAHLLGHAAADLTAQETLMAAAIQRSPSPINFNMGTLVGSYATVAHAGRGGDDAGSEGADADLR